MTHSSVSRASIDDTFGTPHDSGASRADQADALWPAHQRHRPPGQVPVSVELRNRLRSDAADRILRDVRVERLSSGVMTLESEASESLIEALSKAGIPPENHNFIREMTNAIGIVSYCTVASSSKTYIKARRRDGVRICTSHGGIRTVSPKRSSSGLRAAQPANQAREKELGTSSTR